MFTTEFYLVIKNSEGEYFTGEWRSEEQWSSLKYAKRYGSHEEIKEDVVKDRKKADEDEGFDFFKAGTYTIEQKFTVKDNY